VTRDDLITSIAGGATALTFAALVRHDFKAVP
jgi:hypothetical protein